MNRTEALQAMRQGVKVRYWSWWWGKFITSSGEKVVDENGHTYTVDEIMAEEDGWEEYSAPNKR